MKSMDWAVEALRSGVLPRSPAEPPTAQRPAQPVRRLSLSSGKDTLAKPQAAVHGADEALAEGQAHALEDLGNNQDLIEDSQSLGGACDAAPMSPRVNSDRPRMGPGSFSIPTQ